MRLTFCSLLLSISFLGWSQQTFSYQQTKAGHTFTFDYVSGEVLVQFDNRLPRRLENVNDYLSRHQGMRDAGVRAEQLLSSNLNIWRLSIQNPGSERNIIDQLYALDRVLNAQLNHMVSQRSTIPNDPNFNNQWHHVNTGQSGGTVDSDIDSDEAWDITTGGLTATGDTIVVAVIEGGGGNLGVPDLAPNAWKNYGETPNNGVDDDGNGYVDDYNGWNVNSLDDNHGTNNHGTQVSGMIGAKGDDGVGTAGVNWDVKIMLISGQNVNDEASVVAAYDYPLTMRKLYNQSGGTQGAFVVVTNASWGIDGGDPANAPLWCAMYDSLGAHGILNCGATANQNWNIDQTGDLPTTCPSDYMVSVTASNDQDVRTFSGYGQTTIDLAAPGEDVYLPNNSGYGTTSGTSFASPAVAGAIALLYSAPCPSFMNLAIADPQAAADQIRSSILNGVDPVSNLTTETVTGGRLNVHNSLLYLINLNCDSNSCILPTGLAASSVSDSSALIEWNSFSSDHIFEISEDGGVTWTTTLVDTNFLLLDTLSPCTAYQVRVASYCNPDTSTYSALTFQTDGCCENPSLALDLANATDATVSFNSILAAQSYDIRYRPIGGNWDTLFNVTSPVNITGLDSCSDYEVEIRVTCASGTLSFDGNIPVSTTGCGACLDAAYCIPSNMNTFFEWIESVQLGNINLTSGDDDGYAFHTPTTDLHENQNYSMTVEAGYSFVSYNENLTVWIDLNQDGVFDPVSEIVYGPATFQNSTTFSINIPTGVNLGLTRMRIGMQATSSPTECPSSSTYGEYEDYCVTLMPDNSGLDENQVQIILFPNPAGDILNLEVPGIQNAHYEVFDITGRQMLNGHVKSGKEMLDVSGLGNGTYVIKVIGEGGRTLSVNRFIKSK